ncbi:hypothetical protein UAW_01895 [Enterococcus haemoperoxidus ATCC BAA-382]|uniref:Lipoprotein n=1 Tax=Enterococcus haemoperoxidus ATCC BAA-382 TaxID=1158608 RepID=R2SNH4_9ENTE|nr:hypothetical protein [Enterococcus haemoperoxidus]EOH96730.1 hypothetical protein UAW_01895 [Enterococcus haemoperoxidus ATCC BAA-382]EOT60226.1 hypothetical protein I583_02861 [Enterococcus haemoperoxidus ATCC BAA-382]OJG52656.1 hypothetical protein RV06_GL000964 [Enterococcus haemoperoxidus]
MKKIVLSLLVVGVTMSLAGCGSNKSSEEKSTDSSIEQTTEDTAAKEAEKMNQIAENLEDQGVEIKSYGNYLSFIREKGIDYDYFEVTFVFASSERRVIQVRLTLKGNIDGKEKEDLIYEVSKGRMVESSGDNTDIDALAEVLKSIDCSDKDLVEFAQWYHYDNK